ncbi:hydroxyphenylacetyl-CoA thioesterase PaaI [Sphingosinicella microcystinivorans]|uniref:hydroxyphenylacetyl-CoA thioesterase PaaI n=1 Tax=Sphingosinicella microcystinivorans TaxID=335406 RepID=UPI0022F4012C|nr:hydroxyphenylacetyl-CoA thioesterase PaaI [Sphingosinicella microcystinivorans]WBX85364.1 hydroxyphenylacetyl-CoA thioesterase PaaI [Sphingosinicella microcystinivorans]
MPDTTKPNPPNSAPLSADDTALRIARAMAAKEGTTPAFGLEIEAAGEGYARVAMRLSPAMLNGFGMAHGGMVFLLADTAFAYACNSRNVQTVAQHASISFIDAGRAGERLVAEARERAAKGRTGVYAVSVFGEDGRIIAEFQGLSRTIGGPVIEEGQS